MISSKFRMSRTSFSVEQLLGKQWIRFLGCYLHNHNRSYMCQADSVPEEQNSHFGKCSIYTPRFLEQKDSLSMTREVTMIENGFTLYRVNSKLKPDIGLMFVSNSFHCRQVISQRAILVTVLTSSGCLEIPRIFNRSSRIS